jgi:O-antigen/teichoic acid export membrane protein
MTPLRRLLSNTLSLFVGYGASQALTAIAYVLVARAVAPSAFGELAAYMGVAMLVVSIGDFGFTAWVVRELARSESHDVFGASLDVRSAVAASTGGAWVVATGALALLGAAPWYAVVFGLWIAFALMSSTLLAPLQASERMRQVATVAALERVVLVAVVLVGVAGGAPAASMAVGLAVGSFAGAATAAGLVHAPIRGIRFPGARNVLHALRASAGFAMSALALQAQRVDAALVSFIASPFDAGIYAAPARVTGVLSILPISFTTALFPMVAKEAGPIWTPMLRKLLLGVLGIAITVVVPLFVFADVLAEVVLGTDYEESGDVLRVILVGIVIGSLNHPIATVYQARGLEYFVAKAVGAGTAVGLVVIALGAAMAGAEGAALGFVAHQIAVMAVLLVWPRMMGDEKLPTKGGAGLGRAARASSGLDPTSSARSKR